MTGNYIQNNHYFQPLKVPCYQTDGLFRLKPAAFLDMAQEIAYLAANEMGFGYEALLKLHTAWVVSRMQFKFLRPALWREELLLETWHKGQNGLFFLRDFLLQDSERRPLVVGTSSWLIINTETRRLVRSDEMAHLLPLSTRGGGDAIVEPCGKVTMPADLPQEVVKTHVIGYSDIDIVGHTNNARYLVWGMDCIDYEVTSQRPVKSLSINFNHETRARDAVVLSKAVRNTADALVYTVEGVCEGKSVFCAEFVF